MLLQVLLVLLGLAKQIKIYQELFQPLKIHLSMHISRRADFNNSMMRQLEWKIY